MSQMIALGQTIHVNCARCGKHAWHVAVMPGIQKLRCPRCDYCTVIEFYTRCCDDGTQMFKMDVRSCWW